MNVSLRFRKERNRKNRAGVYFTLHRDNTSLPLYNRLGKGQSKPNSLCVKRMFAAIKTFENMMYVSGAIPFPLSEIKIRSIAGVCSHVIWTVPPDRVWSKAFFTIFPIASLVHSISQTRSCSRSPSTRISLFSFWPSLSIHWLNEQSTQPRSNFFSKTIFPVSNRVIFNMDKISCSIRLEKSPFWPQTVLLYPRFPLIFNNLLIHSEGSQWCF